MLCEEYFGVCIGQLRMSPSDFYELTLKEASLAIEANNKTQLTLLDNYSLIVYSAIGKALGGEKWEAMYTKEEQDYVPAEPIKTIYTKEEKQQELNSLKELFGEGV